ncbi:FG-GAP and VCBS repeat-containing protein [Streptomyces sp. NPDC058045]|uniref:FG-GAP and VCBS repeat-containing protein n=1 Tax=Streptomyces sp. NPDC058045 TaxID=3346311 RepID=UPI0036ECCB5E
MNARTRAGRLGLIAAVAVTLAATAPTASADTQRPAGRTLEDDFNGDGYADVAFAAPDATVDGKKQAGYVAVMYGSADGLKKSSRQVFSQNAPGMPGVAEQGDAYGSAVTTADLDGDGYADLVVGSAGENDETVGTDTGSLAVIWGGAKGLATSTTLLTGTEAYEGIGGKVVAGDFDGDGHRDLATVSGSHDLKVLSGPFGRDGKAAGTRVVKDEFDSRILDLASGDLNGDGVTDIAAAMNDGDEYDARRVAYWQGTKGSGPAPYKVVTKADGGRLQGGENLDIGDVDGDGFGDIVVGRAVDGYDSDLDTPLAKGGMVTFLPGGAGGPDVSRAHSFNQDSKGVPGVAEAGDGFGAGVSVGDIDGDGRADVSVGVRNETFDRKKKAGAVVTLRGSKSGLTASGSQVLSQDTPGVPGVAESGDTFGTATKLADTDGDGRADLVVGAPGENEEAGSVWVLPSTASGVNPKGSFTFGAGTLGTVAAGAKLGGAFNF